MSADIEKGLVICTVTLVQANVIDVSTLERHSDEWWDMFWHYYGYYEAKWLKKRSEAKI